MNRLFAVLALSSVLSFSACTTAAGGHYDKDAKWAAQASWTDSCCCNVACPCLFGSGASLGHCEGASLVHIHKGHYDGVNLDGLTVIATYRSKDWVKYYVTDKATKAQTDAVVKLLPAYVKFLSLKKTIEVKNGPIKEERSGDKIKYSGGGTTIEMAVMMGANGKPVKLSNMPYERFPSPAFADHTQYKSVILKHESKDKKFEYKGTNAFTAELVAVSSSDK